MTTEPTRNQTDPIMISFEQVQAAVAALGIADTAHVKDVNVQADKVTVVRYRIEDGRRVYIADGWLTETSVIPVIVDEDATEAAGGVR